MQRRFALIGHLHTLSDLTDFAITSAANGDLLRFNGTDWVNITTATLNATLDHGALLGLTDDDHSQYIRVDGTRAFTGNQSIGGFNLTSVGVVKLTEVADPGLASANELWLHAEDVAGVTQLHVNNAVRKWSVLEESYVIARNTTGSTIPLGSVVYASGSTGQRPEIALADADLHSDVIGVTAEAIANNNYGKVITQGNLLTFDTSAWVAGTILYLSTTAGGVTSTEPNHPASSVVIGVVLYQHATNGIVQIQHHEDNRHADGSWHDTFTIGSAAADRAVLDITASALTGSRTFKFPDVSGTLATLENTHTVSGSWTFSNTTAPSGYDYVFQGYAQFQSGLEMQGYIELAVPLGAAYDYGALYVWDYNATTNEKAWKLEYDRSTKTFGLYSASDAGAGKIAWEATRGTGNVVSIITSGNSTDFPRHIWYVSQTLGNQIRFSSTGTQRLEMYGDTVYAGLGVVSDQTPALASGYAYIEATTYGKTVAASDTSSSIWLGHLRGTEAAKAASQSGDESGDILFYGKNSAATPATCVFGRIVGTVETVSASTVAGGMDIRTHTGTGSATVGQTSRMLFRANGEIRLGTDTWFTFDEHSSAPATPAAGKVALYAKADGLLYSKDDAGVETLVSGGAGGGGGGGGSSDQFAYQTADDFIASSTTLQDSDLSLPLAVGTYKVDILVKVLSHSSPDLKIRLDFSGTATSVITSHTWTSASSSVGGFEWALNTTATAFTHAGDGYVRWSGTINVTVAGTLKLQYGQVTSTANNVGVYAGSCMIVKSSASAAAGYPSQLGYAGL